MKCDELKAYSFYVTVDDDIELHNEAKSFYSKDDVDAAIAELKDENRKLKRVLWHDRAIRAEHMKNLIFEGELIYHDDSGEELSWRIMYRKWERAETACLAKAKKYE